jgi:short-subunit dehydrogenase
MKNIVVLITGASYGIGEATAKIAAERGAMVVLAARSEQRLTEVKESILAKGGIAETVTCDVCSDVDVSKLVSTTINIFGKVDVAILNAGIQYVDSVDKLQMNETERMFQTNVLGAIRCTRAILPDMIERHSGHIIFVSSIMGEISFPYMVPYGASKAAVSAFARGLGREVKGQGIKVSLILPGHTDTHITHHLQNRLPKWYSRSTRTLTTEYVARKLVGAIETGRSEQILGRESIMLSNLVRLSPHIADRVVRKITSN